MKKLFFVTVAVIIIMISGLFGENLMNAQVEEPDSGSYRKYYTSIEIQEGDSLWTIAEHYRPHSGKTTEEIVGELKHMNRLGGDRIHAGNYLTVAYYAPEKTPRRVLVLDLE